MLLPGTEMHIVTFVFVLLETILFFYQLLYYLFRPMDKSRLWYLILLFLLIIYNITGGLFPDPDLNIPIVTQNIIAYGCGFLTASYFPFYFYKGFGLKALRFHAIYGVPLFLILPYLIFFLMVYPLNKDLDLTVKYSVIVPFIYSFIILWAMTKAVLEKYKEETFRSNLVEVIAVYFAVLPWASMTVLSYFHVDQLTEVIVTNGGFIVITILFITRYISKARTEYEQLIKYSKDELSIFEKNCRTYQFTSRELEIAMLIRQGFRYKDIAEKLYISERTVTKHVQNIFEKAGVKNKVELIHKLDHKSGFDTFSVQQTP